MISIDSIAEFSDRPVTTMLVLDALADEHECPSTMQIAYRLSQLRRQGRLKACGYDRRMGGNRARRYVPVKLIENFGEA